MFNLFIISLTYLYELHVKLQLLMKLNKHVFSSFFFYSSNTVKDTANK